MTKNKLTLQYSGFIIFAAKLVSVATGMAFTLLVARYAIRSGTQDEYGVWGTLNMIILPYFTILSAAMPFWTLRFVARDKEGSIKTGIVANTAIAAVVTLAYIALIPVITTAFGQQSYGLLYGIAALQIIEFYLIATLEACIQARQPQYVGYGLLVGEITRILLAYMFMVLLQLSLIGALLSVVIAFAIKTAFYFKAIWKELKGKIISSYIKEWIKGSAFNLYNIGGDRIAAFMFVMLSLYGRDIATSYYTASAIIANIITYSSLLAFALLPKLLAENRLEDATTSLKMVLMFAIPMTFGVIGLADSYLVIQDYSYGIAAPVLMILAADALIFTLSSIYSSVLFGIEKLDEKATVPFKQVARSRLFIAFSLPYAHSAITLPTTFYILTNYAKDQPLLIATYVTAINTIAHLAMFIVLYIIVRRAVNVEIPWVNIARYTGASTVMATILFVIPHSMTLTRTLGLTAIGGIVYLAILMAIDKEARALIATILREVKGRIRRKV